MNRFLTPTSIALLTLSVVACGDDSGTTGAGGAGGEGATASTTVTSTTTSTSSSTVTSSSSAGDGGGGSGVGGGGSGPGVGGGGSGPGGSGPGGSGPGGSGPGGSGQGGEPNLGPCADECANDAGCLAEPPSPGLTCGSCVQGEVAAQSSCALNGALGSECQSDPDCSDYVTCVLSGQLSCDNQLPEGAAKAAAQVLYTCGNCGDGIDGAGGSGQGGSGSGTAPCADDCAADAGCDEDPAAPSGACLSCIGDAVDSQGDCAVSAVFGSECQDDADCGDFVTCVLGGQDDCDLDYPEGSALAQALVFQFCGECGDGNP